MAKDLDKKVSLTYNIVRQVPRGPKVNPETGFLRIVTRAQAKTMRSGELHFAPVPPRDRNPGSRDGGRFGLERKGYKQ